MTTAAASGSSTASGAPSRDTARSRGLLYVFLLGAVTIATTYALGEVVRRVLLVGASMHEIHLFHTVRGVTSSILTAGVVGWALLRSAPPLLAPAPAEPEVEGSAFELERPEHYAIWLVRMRWLVVLGTTCTIIVGVKVVPILPERAWWPMLTTVGLLAGTNVLYSSISAARSRFPLFQVQLCTDLVILTLLLHYSGGIDNPLSVAALFHVVIAGILLPRRQCYAIALLASLLFLLLAWGEHAQLLAGYPLLAMPMVFHQGSAPQPIYEIARVTLHAAALFVIAYFVTTLAERARTSQSRLAQMAETALAERQLLERALETTGVGLCVLGGRLQPEWQNSRWTGWFPDATSVPGEPVGAAARATLTDGRIRRVELSLGAAGSSRVQLSPEPSSVFLVTTAPIRDVEGRIRQVAELIEDITEARQTQARLLDACQMAAVGRLAGQIAHEVNNPIAIISGKALLLLSHRREEMSEKVASELDKIVTLSNRVAGIAQQLLSYCRPSRGPRARLDLGALARSVISMIEQRARDTGVEITDHLDAALPVEANAGEMDQVFLNLALNALDVMPNGGRLSLVALPVEPLPDGRPSVGVAFEDTGPGVPPEHRTRVWEPFFSTKSKGTGLGLSICKGLVESHGGRIEVGASEGGGARFVVRLPCAHLESGAPHA